MPAWVGARLCQAGLCQLGVGIPAWGGGGVPAWPLTLHS